MMTAESMSSKNSVLRIIVILSFLVKLFSSHTYGYQIRKSFDGEFLPLSAYEFTAQKQATSRSRVI